MAQAQPVTTHRPKQRSVATTSLPELSVVLFNVHSSDAGVKAADRQNCLREVLDSVLSQDFMDPLFILCQESINGPKHKIVCQKLGQQPKAIRCQAEAGVYYRPDPTGQHKVRYVDVSILRKTEDQIGLEPNVPFEVARLMACMLTKPGSGSGEKILLLSWHGPETKAKKNVELKKGCFRRLIRFTERLRREESCDIVLIGGDFNLPAPIASQLMDTFRRDGGVDGAVLDQYTPPPDRQSLPVKDFIVYWPEKQLQNIEISVISPDYRREKGSRPFDHPIIGFKFGNKATEVPAQGCDKVTSRQPEE